MKNFCFFLLLCFSSYIFGEYKYMYLLEMEEFGICMFDDTFTGHREALESLEGKVITPGSDDFTTLCDALNGLAGDYATAQADFGDKQAGSFASSIFAELRILCPSLKL